MPDRANATLPRVPGTLDQLVDVETPEQIVFSYTVAGIGSRAAAALIDYFITASVVLLLWLAFAIVAPYLRSLAGSGEFLRVAGSWAIALLILGQFLVLWGYNVLFEVAWDGQTPGKRRMGIRVVQDGGYSISVGASLVRNLARLVDMQPGFVYGVGILSAAVSSSGKRLGDILAGTFVVRERVVELAPASTSAPERPGAPAVSAALSEQELELLERFLGRRASLDAALRSRITAQLVERFGDRLAPFEGSPLARLLRLAESERSARARGVAARGETGAAREQHAIVAQGAARWSAFARELAEAQRHGLKGMTEQRLSEFVAQYRELSTDLARLKTAGRGRDSDALFYVSRLVGAGHNLLYRQRPLAWKTLGRFLWVTIPGEIRRSAAVIMLAAGSLFLPMILTCGAVSRNADLGQELLPPEMLDRAEEGVARAREGKGYIDIRDEERPVMASAIATNNIQVTYAAFASGITAGIGTLLLLVFNGVGIGAAVGLYASKGIAPLILEFVVAHGVLELTAICIAGGGGLLIGSAILLPGALTRRAALVVRGRRALTLIAGSTLLLVPAGLIEGLISPREDVPAAWKIAVAAASALAIAGYVMLGRRQPLEAPTEISAYSDARALISR
ncbi:MAG: stage II sporulation protein M [Gemmatimonadaceae bacterium]